MREVGSRSGADTAGSEQQDGLDEECRRLLWRCRRGMKELDIMLERYARARLPEASADQRRLFERLLELPDPVLADYLLGQESPGEPLMASLVRLIGAPPAPSR